MDPPEFRTISRLASGNLKALGALFLAGSKFARRQGWSNLGHVALDGTKIKANASKHKAMSYERMKKREAELKAEVARLRRPPRRRTPRGRDLRQGQARRRDAGLGRRQAEAAGEDPSGDGGAGGGTPGWAVEEERASRPKRNSSAKPRPQEAGQNRRRRHRMNPNPSRNELHRSGKAAS